MALCDSSDYGSKPPPSGKQCSKCNRKYAWIKKFCGIDGAALVPWHDPGFEKADRLSAAKESPAGAQLDFTPAEPPPIAPPAVHTSPVDFQAAVEALKAATSLDHKSEPGAEKTEEPTVEPLGPSGIYISGPGKAKVKKRTKTDAAAKHASNQPPVPPITPEPEAVSSSQPPAAQSKISNNAAAKAETQPSSPVSPAIEAESTRAEPILPPPKPMDEPIGDKLSQVDFALVTEWLTIDQTDLAVTQYRPMRHKSRELPAPLPVDKLSQVDFEMVTELLTQDQSETALKAAEKIEQRGKRAPHIPQTERITEQLSDLQPENDMVQLSAPSQSQLESQSRPAESVNQTAAVPKTEVDLATSEPAGNANQVESAADQTPTAVEPGPEKSEPPTKEQKLAGIDSEPPAYKKIEQWSFALKEKSDSTENEVEPRSKESSDTIIDGDRPDDEEEDFSFADDLQLVGKVLESKYEIESVLAEGGMAVLYLAKQKKMERTVVVKVVHNYLSHNQNEIQRFEREAQVVARLNHPNIVAVYDFGLIDGNLPFIVMEYIRGMNLAQKVSRHGPPGMAVAVRIIRQICRGLEEAHSLGIIHRDLKPDNIILQEKFDRPDWVKIVDFGIAHRVDTQGKRLTRAGRMLGTPEYASPEQFKDVKLDPRSDIYSLGVVIFEMLTGHVPYEAGNLGALMAKILLDPVPSITSYRQDIEPDSPLDVLVRKCMEKDPDNRFQTVREVRKAADAAHHSE